MAFKRLFVINSFFFIAIFANNSSLRSQEDIRIDRVTGHASAYTGNQFGSDSELDIILSREFSAFARANFAGESAGYQNIYGINAVYADVGFGLGDTGRYSGDATTNYEATFLGQNVARSIPFTFVINGGQLRLNNYKNIDQGIFSRSHVSVDADINLRGLGKWNMIPVLELDDNTGLPVVYFDSDSRDDFGVGFPNLSVYIDGNDAVVDIPRFEGEVLIPGNLFWPGLLFEYDMEAELDFWDSPGAGGFAAITDPFSLHNGDPNAVPGTEFFLDGRPLSDYPITQVPEPTSQLLAAMAIGGVVMLRRNRRR